MTAKRDGKNKSVKLRHVQLTPSDFLSDSDFQIWDAETRGVYITIILYMYSNGGYIENEPDALKRMAGCRDNTWECVYKTVCKKFKVRGTKLYHKRVVFELKRVNEFWQKKHHAGVRGAEKRWQNNSTANGKPIAKVRKGKVSKGKEDKTPISPEGTCDVANESFEQFWGLWPQHHRKVDKQKCLKKWQTLKLHLDERIIPALEKWKQSEQWTKDGGQFIPAPHKWLNQGFYAVDLESIKLPGIATVEKTPGEIVLEQIQKDRI